MKLLSKFDFSVSSTRTEEKGGLSTGAVVAISIGSAVAVISSLILVLWCLLILNRRRRQLVKATSSNISTPAPAYGSGGSAMTDVSSLSLTSPLPGYGNYSTSLVTPNFATLQVWPSIL